MGRRAKGQRRATTTLAPSDVVARWQRIESHVSELSEHFKKATLQVGRLVFEPTYKHATPGAVVNGRRPTSVLGKLELLVNYHARLGNRSREIGDLYKLMVDLELPPCRLIRCDENALMPYAEIDRAIASYRDAAARDARSLSLSTSTSGSAPSRR